MSGLNLDAHVTTLKPIISLRGFPTKNAARTASTVWSGKTMHEREKAETRYDFVVENKQVHPKYIVRSS